MGNDLFTYNACVRVFHGFGLSNFVRLKLLCNWSKLYFHIARDATFEFLITETIKHCCRVNYCF